VLVLYSNSRLEPVNVLFDSGLRQVINAGSGQPVEIFSEFLDEPQFHGDRYELTVSTYLQDKYADRPPDVVLIVADSALRFILRYRDRLFPAVPVVYALVTRELVQSIPTLPPDMVGAPVTYDFAGTVEQALKWHPRATHLVIVTGASKQDDWELLLRSVTPILGHVQPEYLTGLPLATLQKRLRELGSDSVVFTPGFFQDGDGHPYLPRDAAALVAAASSAPVYAPFEPFMGTGIVGGSMMSFEQMGRQSAQILGRLFSGQPDWHRVPQLALTVLEVDWRQIKRWGIDPKLLPHDTVIAFRAPTLWQAFRNEVLSALTVIVLLSALVVSLLLERRRRHHGTHSPSRRRSARRPVTPRGPHPQ
jgi:hypothetical protein